MSDVTLTQVALFLAAAVVAAPLAKLLYERYLGPPPVPRDT